MDSYDAPQISDMCVSNQIPEMWNNNWKSYILSQEVKKENQSRTKSQ